MTVGQSKPVHIYLHFAQSASDCLTTKRDAMLRCVAPSASSAPVWLHQNQTLRSERLPQLGDPLTIEQTPNAIQTFETSPNFRDFSFFRPADLSVYRHPHGPGDDGRADLPTDEILVFSLLANRSPAAERRVFGFDRPILCVTHSRQPLCGVVWDRGDGPEPFITEGRQRGGSTEERGEANPGAIEAINRRVAQLVALAFEIASKDAEAAEKPDVLKVKTRSEASARCKRGEAGWEWAEQIVLPLYVGGRIGDAAEPGQAPPSYPSMIEWLPVVFEVVAGRQRQGVDASLGELVMVSGPKPIPYVAWVAWEPEDRDPATAATQLASLGLKGAQVATPPTVLARQYQSLCAPPAPMRLEGESEEAYGERIRAGGPYGQGLPVRFVAKHSGIDPAWVHFHVKLLDLIPEVQAAVDASARGEEGGLSLKQVKNGGFFASSSGGPGNKGVPKSREEQLRLLAELAGRRGLRRDGSSREDEVDSGASAPPASGEGWSDPSRKREVSVEDSAGDRHSADENRAAPGPDSPRAAGLPPKPARLDGDLFVALRDRLYSCLETVTPDEDGKLPDGKQHGAEHRLLEFVYETAYNFAAFFAGDVGAFTSVSGEGSPTLHLGFTAVKDCLDEVLRARGLAIRPTVGAVATGVPVLPSDERKQAEVIGTPREVASAPKSEPVKTDDKPTKSVKAPKIAKPAKPAKPKKAARRGPLKPAKAKPAKAVKSKAVATDGGKKAKKPASAKSKA